jgi:DNA-binding GntR family transcriptional regulator
MLGNAFKLKSVSKPILREEVYTCVKEAILTGEIAPGERLSVGRLQKDIGLSHTPIREALLKLEQEGFVSRLAKGGFIVSQFSKKDIEEIFDLRCILESHAITFTIENISEKDIKKLEKNIKESEYFIREKRLDQVSKLNTEFHDLINGFCKNERLLNLINDLRDQIFQYRSAIIRVPHMAKLSINHHKQMIQAIKEKDLDSLKTLTVQHAMKGKEIIMTEVEEGNIKTIKV